MKNTFAIISLILIIVLAVGILPGNEERVDIGLILL